MKRNLMPCVLAIPLFLCTRNGASAATYWVSVNGDDTCILGGSCGTNPGCPSLGTGTVTLRNALYSGGLLGPGDIVNICPGRYYPPNGGFAPPRQVGSSASPIQYRAYPPGPAIIDASSANTQRGGAAIDIWNWQDVVFDGLTVLNATRGDGFCDTSTDCDSGRCAGGNGFKIGASNGILLNNFTFSNICRAAVLIFDTSSNITVQNSEVSLAVRENIRRAEGGSAAGIGSICYTGGCPRNITIQNNKIHDVYSECLTLGDQDGSIIDNNTLYNCFGANLYLPNVTDTTVRNNYLYNLSDPPSCPARVPPGCNCDQMNPTPGCFYRTWDLGLTFLPAMGISLSKEGPNPQRASPISRVRIYNNVMDNHRTGFDFYWDDHNDFPYNTYDHIEFSNNVIKRTTPPVQGAAYGPINIAQVSGSGALPRCSRLENNVIYGTHVYLGGRMMQDAAWSPNPSPVSRCTEDGFTGSVNNNVFVDLADGSSLPPGESANLFNVNPLLCNPDPLSSTSPSILGYFVTAASRAVGQGIFQPLAPLDYDGIPRSAAPSINAGINQNTTCR